MLPWKRVLRPLSALLLAAAAALRPAPTAAHAQSAPEQWLERLLLQAVRRPPPARRPRTRNLRQRHRQLAGPRPVSGQPRVLRLLPRLRPASRRAPLRRARPHRQVGRPARHLRRQGARRDRHAQGRPGRPLAGRHDAALVPEVPRRRRQGQRPRRDRPRQPRHHPRRPDPAPAVLPRRREPADARHPGSPTRSPARPSSPGSTRAATPSPASTTRSSRASTTRWSPPTARSS